MICRPNCLYFTAGVVQRRFETTTPVGIKVIRKQRLLSSDNDSSVILIATAYTLWGHHVLQNLSSLATPANTHTTASKVQHRQFNSPQNDTAICHFLLAAHPPVCCYYISTRSSILKQHFSNIFPTIVYGISGVKRDWAQCKFPWGHKVNGINERLSALFVSCPLFCFIFLCCPPPPPVDAVTYKKKVTLFPHCSFIY
jgi:hypothetical protein